jgi:glycosylphosphatidylinositol transamidase (GPIT) subunit GPI8
MKVSRGVIVLVSSLMLLVAACGHQLENGGKIWALLVAGSNGYDNYRHQVCIILDGFIISDYQF